jgi:hypothetical protein
MNQFFYPSNDMYRKHVFWDDLYSGFDWTKGNPIPVGLLYESFPKPLSPENMSMVVALHRGDLRVRQTSQVWLGGRAQPGRNRWILTGRRDENSKFAERYDFINKMEGAVANQSFIDPQKCWSQSGMIGASMPYGTNLDASWTLWRDIWEQNHDRDHIYRFLRSKGINLDKITECLRMSHGPEVMSMKICALYLRVCANIRIGRDDLGEDYGKSN